VCANVFSRNAAVTVRAGAVYSHCFARSDPLKPEKKTASGDADDLNGCGTYNNTK